jgi:hypothetical protein
MNGYDAFQTYQAVRLHFMNDKFDYFAYNGKSKTSPEAFNLRKDKYTFHKIARMFDEAELPYFFAINFLKRDSKAWIAGMLQEEAFEVFKNWKKWQEDRVGNLKNNLVGLSNAGKFENLIISKDGQFPELLNMVLRNDLNYDVLVILDHYIHFMDSWDKKIEDDFIWKEFHKKFKKYKPFFLSYAPLSDMFYKKMISEGLRR